jgi:O-antigen/teichoic acid export membrane protein
VKVTTSQTESSTAVVSQGGLQPPERLAVSDQLTARTLVKSSAWVFAAQLLLLVCGLTNNFLVARLLNREGKGLVFLLQVISSLGFTFLQGGLGPASVFYLRSHSEFRQPEIASANLLPSIVLGVIPALCCLALWPWLPRIIPAGMTPGLALISVLAIPGLIIAFHAGYFCLGQQRTSGYNFYRVLQPALFSMFLVALLFTSSQTVREVAILWLISNVLPIIPAAKTLVSGGARLLGSSRRFLRAAFAFGFRSQLGSVTQFLQHRVDVLLVGYFLAIRDVGIYSVAVTIAELLWYVPYAVGPVLLPHIAGSSEEHARRVTPAFCRTCLALNTVLGFVLFSASALMIPIVLPAFTASIPVLWLLFPGTVFATLFKILSADFTGRGRPLDAFYPALATLIAETLVGVVVIRSYGISGAALLVSAAYVLNSVISIRLYCHSNGVPAIRLLIPHAEDFRMLAFLWTHVVDSIGTRAALIRNRMAA